MSARVRKSHSAWDSAGSTANWSIMMKTWVHRDAKGNVLAVVATDDSERGELSLVLEDAAVVSEINCAGFDDPRDFDQLQRILSMPEIAS